jgi:hypothetical protein
LTRGEAWRAGVVLLEDQKIIAEAWRDLCTRRQDFVGRNLDIDVYCELIECHRLRFGSEPKGGEKWDRRRTHA